MMLLLVLLVSSVSCLKLDGKAKPIFHDNLSSDLAFDICSDKGAAPEYVKLINKTDHASVTYNINNLALEQVYDDKKIGFGVYPTNKTGIISVHAWYTGHNGKMVSFLVDMKNGTILSTEYHTDFNKVMCYGNALDHNMIKRGLGDWVVGALRKVCSYTLDFSPMGDICETSLTGACVAIAATLEAAIAIPGDSLIWFPVCKGALKAFCAETAGAADPSAVEVCKYIEQYIRDNLSRLFG